jgi:hypothetical protein
MTCVFMTWNLAPDRGTPLSWHALRIYSKEFGILRGRRDLEEARGVDEDGDAYDSRTR